MRRQLRFRSPATLAFEAKRYEDKLKSGNYLIAVHAHDGDETDRAKEIFKDRRR